MIFLWLCWSSTAAHAAAWSFAEIVPSSFSGSPVASSSSSVRAGSASTGFSGSSVETWNRLRSRIVCRSDQARAGSAAPTLAMGVSIDHFFSIAVALISGVIWQKWGYQYVFLAGAGIAVVNFFSALRVRIPQRTA